MEKFDVVCQLYIGCGEKLTDAGDNVGTTLLSAVELKHEECVKTAAAHGHDDCVEALFNAGADVNMVEEQSSICAIAAAVKSGNHRCVELLLKAGADVNMKCKGKSQQINALLEAVKCGNDDIVKLLLQAGANVNDTDGTGYSPLALASKDGHFKIVDLLIKAGADVNYGRKSALIEATVCSFYSRSTDNFTKCVDILLQAGADVNVLGPLFETPLVVALNMGFDEGLDLLIKAGSDVNKFTRHLSPLMRAAGVGFLKCVQLLLTAGADVNTTNYNNQTAFSSLSYTQPRFMVGNPDLNEILQEVVSRINHIQCGKILRAGAKINNTEWGACSHMEENKARELDRFIYAAGQSVQGPPYRPAGQATVPKYLLFEDLRFNLKHLCRQAIRKHLLNVNRHEYLFRRIPRLGLPAPLTRYLLYNFSLED